MKSENGLFTASINQYGYFTVYYLIHYVWTMNVVIDLLEIKNDGNLGLFENQDGRFISPSLNERGEYIILDDDGGLKVFDLYGVVIYSIGHYYSIKH